MVTRQREACRAPGRELPLFMVNAGLILPDFALRIRAWGGLTQFDAAAASTPAGGKTGRSEQQAHSPRLREKPVDSGVSAHLGLWSVVGICAAEEGN